jgi:chaperonin GroEL
LNTCDRVAVEEGIVVVGSVALLSSIKVLAGLNPENDDQKSGTEIVRRALQAPARQIVANAGAKGSVVAGKLLEKGDSNYGFALRPRRGPCAL